MFNIKFKEIVMTSLAKTFFLTVISSSMLICLMSERKASALKTDWNSPELRTPELNIKTCSVLQTTANRIWQENRISFQEFEKKQILEQAYPRTMDHPGGTVLSLAYTMRLCKGGYITKISPLGKRICEGTLLAYIDTGMKKPKFYWAPGYDMDTRTPYLGNYPKVDEARYCRYVG
jgi:hypothetical protein